MSSTNTTLTLPTPGRQEQYTNGLDEKAPLVGNGKYFLMIFGSLFIVIVASVISAKLRQHRREKHIRSQLCRHRTGSIANLELSSQYKRDKPRGRKSGNPPSPAGNETVFDNPSFKHHISPIPLPRAARAPFSDTDGNHLSVSHDCQEQLYTNVVSVNTAANTRSMPKGDTKQLDKSMRNMGYATDVVGGYIENTHIATYYNDQPDCLVETDGAAYMGSFGGHGMYVTGATRVPADESGKKFNEPQYENVAETGHHARGTCITDTEMASAYGKPEHASRQIYNILPTHSPAAWCDGCSTGIYVFDAEIVSDQAGGQNIQVADSGSECSASLYGSAAVYENGSGWPEQDEGATAEAQADALSTHSDDTRTVSDAIYDNLS